MIHVTNSIQLDPAELQFKFLRSPGPGGQHVNRAATAVQLRFDVASSQSLPDDVRQKLYALAGKRINSQGVLVIQANRFRSQDLNRKDALERLKNLILSATEKTKARRKTKPTAASVKKRLASKTRRARLKQYRRTVDHEEK